MKVYSRTGKGIVHPKSYVLATFTFKDWSVLYTKLLNAFRIIRIYSTKSAIFWW